MFQMYQKATISKQIKKNIITHHGVIYSVKNKSEPAYAISLDKENTFNTLILYEVHITLLYEATFLFRNKNTQTSLHQLTADKQSLGTYSMTVNHASKKITFAAHHDLIFKLDQMYGHGIGTFAFNELVWLSKQMPEDYSIAPLTLSEVDVGKDKYDGKNLERRSKFYSNFGFKLNINSDGHGHASVASPKDLKTHVGLRAIEQEPSALLEKNAELQLEYMARSKQIFQEISSTNYKIKEVSEYPRNIKFKTAVLIFVSGILVSFLLDFLSSALYFIV